MNNTTITIINIYLDLNVFTGHFSRCLEYINLTNPVNDVLMYLLIFLFSKLGYNFREFIIWRILYLSYAIPYVISPPPTEFYLPSVQYHPDVVLIKSEKNGRMSVLLLYPISSPKSITLIYNAYLVNSI